MKALRGLLIHVWRRLLFAVFRRCAGLSWRRDGEYWYATSGRYELLTWPFGPIHQCKVFVTYAGARKPTEEGCVGIGLDPGKTRIEAMLRAAAWMREYERTGPEGPEKVFRDCFVNFRTLFRTRPDVLNQLFFTIGGGYTWLDGAIVSRSRDTEWEWETRQARLREACALMDPWEARWRRRRNDEEAALPVGPLPDDGGPRRFYPASENYSNVCLVPDDVRPEWLALAYEAAAMLRDRSGVPPEEKEMEGPNPYMEAALKELTPELRDMLNEIRKEVGRDRVESTAEAEDAVKREVEKRRRDEEERLAQERNRELGARVCLEIERRFRRSPQSDFKTP